METFLAVVLVDLTVPASEASHTVTLVVVLLIEAGRSVLTGGTERQITEIFPQLSSSLIIKYKIGG